MNDTTTKLSPGAQEVSLTDRAHEILRHIVEAYVETGEPVGSRTLSKRLDLSLSPATIRNVMADLEESGLLYAPHVSAGRLPTDAGLRLFVDGLLEVGTISSEDRESIEAQCASQGRSLRDMLTEASAMLSGLSRCAGLVLAPKASSRLRHIEFVSLAPGRALVVIVNENGAVENRIMEVPVGLPSSSLVEAGNYLSARLVGRTLDEAIAEVRNELEREEAELNERAAKLVEAGLADWSGAGRQLIVRGQSNLLADVTAVEDLERVRILFDALERKETMLNLLGAAESGEGVKIFIGAENNLFGLTGCSMVVSPYKNAQQEIVGAIGVVGPTRINYARIIPMVDYTAQLIGRLMP